MILDHKVNRMNNLRCSSRRLHPGCYVKSGTGCNRVSGKNETKLHCAERLDILVVERLRVAS
jgi:hypothetical protein